MGKFKSFHPVCLKYNRITNQFVRKQIQCIYVQSNNLYLYNNDQYNNNEIYNNNNNEIYNNNDIYIKY